MSTLVTGGAGFIGSHLIEMLLEQTDDQIICLDNFNEYYSPAVKRQNIAGFADSPRVELVEIDFCDVAAIDGLFSAHDIQRVAHLGGYAGVRPSVSSPLVYQQSNVQGTLTLLEACRKHPVSRFLLASSSTAYGKGASAPFCEDAPTGVPTSPYGATKRSAELLAQTYHELHQTRTVCIRPFSVYGPRLRPDLAMMIFAQSILDGAPIRVFGDGSAERDFTYVEDICRGMFSALTTPGIDGEIINLGCGQPIAVSELINALSTALEREAIIEHQPEHPEDLPITHADLSKAERLLDYTPQVPFAEGARRFADWYRTTHAATMRAS